MKRFGILFAVLLSGTAIGQSIAVPGGSEPAPPAAGDTAETDAIRRKLIGQWEWIYEDTDAGFKAVTTETFTPEGKLIYERMLYLTKTGQSAPEPTSEMFYRVEALGPDRFTMTVWTEGNAPGAEVKIFSDPDTLMSENNPKAPVFKRKK